MNQTARRPGLGILLAILATLCFALLDTGSQYAGRLAVPVLMAIWLRFAIQTLMTTALLWPQYRGRLFQTQAPRAQLLRGLLMIGSFGFSFMSLMFIPVGEFTAIMMLIPLAVTLLASLILRERVGPLGWLLVAGGFSAGRLTSEQFSTFQSLINDQATYLRLTIGYATPDQEKLLRAKLGNL